MGKDTILPNMLNHEFKILHYIDTIGCTNCHLQLFDWKLYMKELKSSSIDIALIFVVFTKNYEEFEIIQRNNHFFYPVIYDYNGLLNKKNQFPTYPYPLHTYSSAVVSCSLPYNRQIQSFSAAASFHHCHRGYSNRNQPEGSHLYHPD